MTRVLALVLAVGGVLAGVLLAQEAADSKGQPGMFVDAVEVNVVNIDVFVTDKKGNPVTDLTKEDFRVFENGDEVNISNFQRIDDWIETKGSDPRNIIPGTVPGADPLVAEAPTTDRLYMVVFIDNLNIAPFNRNRVFVRLRRFLSDHLRGGDRIMLATFNRSLKIRTPFTSDPMVINSALFAMEDESGLAVHRNAERTRTLKAIEDSESFTEAVFWARSVAESDYNDTQMTISGLRDLVDMVAGLQGRKAVVHVSDGIPLVAGDDLFYAINEKFQNSSAFSLARDFDSSRDIQSLVALSNSSRVTFYTIDAGGLRVGGSSSVEQANAGVSAFVDSQYIQNLQASIIRIARDTGGKAIINTNDVGPDLESVARDLRTYYSLGYNANHFGDGRYHRIEVKVKRKGVRVRHRTGYRDLNQFQRMEQGTLAALRFGEEENPLGLQLRFGKSIERAEGTFVVPVVIGIPLGEITLVLQGDRYLSSFRLYVAAMDVDGGTSTVQEVRVPIEVPELEYDLAVTKGWAYEMPLLMRPGEHRVAIGARDDFAGTTSYVSRQVRVGVN